MCGTKKVCLSCAQAQPSGRLLLFEFNGVAFALRSFEGICLLFGANVSTQGNVSCTYKKVLNCIRVARVNL